MRACGVLLAAAVLACTADCRLLRIRAWRGGCRAPAGTAVSCEAAAPDGLLPHPDDCELFYYCAAAAPVCRRCPAALHFNPQLRVCDYPWRAGCRADTTDTTPHNTTAPLPPSPDNPDDNSTVSYPPELPINP